MIDYAKINLRMHARRYLWRNVNRAHLLRWPQDASRAASGARARFEFEKVSGVQ
jgi:hypothetical protein